MIALTLTAHTKDLGGGFEVRRLLPAAACRMVGPFVFFDHMGPAYFAPGHGIDVRPHPHIGLATVTYLFEGAIMHRDSLGCVQRIEPGDVNWMTAGRGIVHSERSPTEDRDTMRGLHGIQTWIALPRAHEQTAPAFSHHPKTTLPVTQWGHATMRLIAGEAYGLRAPVKTYSPMFYGAVETTGAAQFELPTEYAERAIYVVEGDVTVGGTPVAPRTMAVIAAGAATGISVATGARLMLLGGAAIDGERLLSWNFVASNSALIEDARARWRERRFEPVPGETEFIPLPER